MVKNFIFVEPIKMESTSCIRLEVIRRIEANCIRGISIEFCIPNRKEPNPSARKKRVIDNPIPIKDLVTNVILITFRDSSFLFILPNRAIKYEQP